jgi:hypothetical protein
MVAGLISGGASLVGGFMQNSAAKKANKISAQALADSKAQQEKVWNTVTPYTGAGGAAVNTLADPNALMAGFKTDPGYAFRMSQGLDAVNTNRATNGLLRSGSAIKAVNDYAANQASNEFGKYVSRTQNVAQLGLQGAGIGAGAANQTQQAIQTNAGNAGGAAIAQGNTNAGIAGSIGTLLAKYLPSGGGAAAAAGGSSYGGGIPF